MDNNPDPRLTGQLSLSIATSLAFEGLFGIMQDKENPINPPLDMFNEVWVNIRTLFRNVHGCIDKEREKRLLPDDYSNIIIQEMNIITGLITDKHPMAKVHFYACSYQTLSRLYPFSVFKEVKTELQKAYAAMENEMLRLLFMHFGNSDEYVHIFDTYIMVNEKKVLLLTHYPLDLLNVKGSNLIGLLESHTGVVKLKPQWNTKLNTSEYLRLPFDRMTVQLFGDSGGLLKPYPSDIRKKVLEIAIKNKWNSQTTKDRIIHGVEAVRDPVLEAGIKRLY